jgi:hypothetical protein
LFLFLHQLENPLKTNDFALLNECQTNPTLSVGLSRIDEHSPGKPDRIRRPNIGAIRQEKLPHQKTLLKLRIPYWHKHKPLHVGNQGDLATTNL